MVGDFKRIIKQEMRFLGNRYTFSYNITIMIFNI